MRRRLGIAWLAFVLCVGFAPAGRAFPLLRLRPAGTPFEGPTDAEPTSIWWNPAALALVRGANLWLDGQLLLRRGNYERPALDAATGLPASSSDRAASSTDLGSMSFPYFFAAAFHLPTWNLTLALGVFDPWKSTCDAGPCGGLALPAGYHLVSESFQQIYISFAVAAQISTNFSVGVTLSAIDAFADLAFYRDTALDGGSAAVRQPSPLCGGAPCGYENPAAAMRVKIHGDGGSLGLGIPSPSGLGIGLGLLYRPVEQLSLGLSWNHVFPFAGSASPLGEKPYLLGAPRGAEVIPPPGAGDPCGGPCFGSAQIAYPMPDVFHLGARIQLRQNLELTAGGRLVVYGGYGTSSDPALGGVVVRLSGPAVTAAGAPEQIVLGRGLRPAIGTETGLRWSPLRRLRLGLSLIGESAAVPESHVSPAAVDALKLDSMLAAEWRFPHFRLLAAYGLTLFLPTSNAPGAFDPNARVGCVDAGYALDACAADLQGRGTPTAAGRTSMMLHQITAAAGFDF